VSLDRVELDSVQKSKLPIKQSYLGHCGPGRS
jgi:hypothetical protein